LFPADQETFEYVSLGDSICAGHAIDRGWYDNYGTGVQYNKEDAYGNSRGNYLTTLLPNTYTALLQKELQRALSIKNPKVKVNATSFGHSGATVDDLVDMLCEGTEVA
jgi:predicted alpha-1,6-mannanase (GH76 family)